MRNRIALVFCVHHKPWLMMSTLITTLVQDYQETDFYIIYNIGDGRCAEKASYQEYHRFAGTLGPVPPLRPELERESYQEYDQLARKHGMNSKLSPFDDRVRRICQIRRPNVYELEFENDHALDSGVWYKFIKTGLWRKYDYVFCIQEGTLLTRRNVISAALRLAADYNVHFLAAGHYKERLPKEFFLRWNTRGPDPTPLDFFHDHMIRATFDIFCRDPEFKELFERWPNDINVTQQNHVPDIWKRSLWRRVRNAVYSDGPLPTHPLKRPTVAVLRGCRNVFPRVDSLVGQARVVFADFLSLRCDVHSNGAEDSIYVSAAKRRLGDLVSIVEIDNVKFHREVEAEWHGCSCNHMFSREFLERITERLERYSLYDALDLPFAGTALEVIWGFLPNWLGFEKWFFDGYHRVAKNFETYRREDDPSGMADYINRYYIGRLYVAPEEDYLKIKRTSRQFAHLREVLSKDYS